MAEATSATSLVYASAVAADAFARSLLQAHGVPPEDAAIIAGCLVSADLRGVDTHGLCRLPIYLERVRAGLINPKPNLNPKRVTPVAATLDGENGFGFVIGMRAMTEAIAMAREFGIGVVSARRSTHFGMAASYALPAVEAGLMAMVFSNASQAMPPWGSKQMLLGTNPFCMAAVSSISKRTRLSLTMRLMVPRLLGSGASFVTVSTGVPRTVARMAATACSVPAA